MGPGATAMKPVFLIGIFLIAVSSAAAQSSRYTVQEKETVERRLEFAGSGSRVVELDNVSGSIRVTRANGPAVEMTANKTIRAESQDRVQDARRDVTLDISDRAETVRIYVNGPFRCQCSEGRDGWRSFGARWNDPGYRVDIDFELKVPDGTKMRLRTVNAGDIKIENTTGDFEIENVNGGITMTDIRGSGYAHTVNGPVRV